MFDDTNNEAHRDPNSIPEKASAVQPGLDGLLGDEEASGPSVGSVGREALKRGSEETEVDDTSKGAGS